MYRVSVDCFDRHTLVVVEDCLCYHRPFVNDVPIRQNQAALLVHNKPARQWGLYGEGGEDKQKFLNVTVSFQLLTIQLLTQSPAMLLASLYQNSLASSSLTKQWLEHSCRSHSATFKVGKGGCE